MVAIRAPKRPEATPQRVEVSHVVAIRAPKRPEATPQRDVPGSFPRSIRSASQSSKVEASITKRYRTSEASTRS